MTGHFIEIGALVGFYFPDNACALERGKNPIDGNLVNLLVDTDLNQDVVDAQWCAGIDQHV